MQKKIHIGTSGWSYKHWKGIFYPEDLKPTGWLQFYTTHFSITEINSSFYHLPLKKTVTDWVKKVPDNFYFCPKMSRYLTHLKKLNEPEESLERFFDVFEPMHEKMGPVLVQLPRSVPFDKEKTEHFYDVLKSTYKDYMFSMEVRHESWLEEESIAMMKKYHIGTVISQSGRGFPYTELVTAKHIYMRFHGPKELYASSYTDAELKHYANLFKKWLEEKHSIWCFFNNDIHGYALENAKTLQQMFD